MYLPRSNYEWAFSITIAVQVIGTSVLDLVLLERYLSWVTPVVYEVQRSYVVPVHTGAFVLGNFVLAALAFDALDARNSLQLIGLCVFDICVFIYCVMRYFETLTNADKLGREYNGAFKPFTDPTENYPELLRPMLLTSTIIVGICAALSCFLAWKLSVEFAWAIYRQVSGNIKARRRYLAYQILLVLIKLEVYFFIAFIIVYGFVNVHYEIPEFPLTMALIPLLLILLGLTIFSIKHENMPGAIVAMLLRLGEMAYITSRIAFLNGNSYRARTLLKDEMLFLAAVALAFAIAACVNAIVCMTNFGHGLKPILLDSSWKRNSRSFAPMHAQTRYAERLELD